MLKTLLNWTRIASTVKICYLCFLSKVSALLDPRRLQGLEKTPNVEAGNIASAFDLFIDYFDKRLIELKRDIREDSLSNTDLVARKLKDDSKISFRFERNKTQYIFNSDLLEKAS